jgi:hypothetical protein
MRNNLVFSGIKVNEKPEDTELILRNFMTSEMKLAQDLVNDLKFERVHSTGDTPSYSTSVKFGRPRNIVAKFTYFKEREIVRRASPVFEKKTTCSY